MISVIIPTYGDPIFLRVALNSVLSQTFQDFEIIVVDDNDPQSEYRIKTRDIIKSFNDNRINYVCHPRNLNGAAARNTGIKIAKGEYIAFLDSDDEYLPKRLELCKTVLDRAENTFAAVYSGCEFRKKGKKYASFINVKSGNFLVETLACSFSFCTGSNIFVRKDVIDELHGFDESFIRHQDYEFLVRLFEKYNIISIPQVLVIKNNEGFNLPNVNKMIDIKEKYLKKYEKIIETLDNNQVEYIYKTQWLQIAEAALKTGEKKISKEYYLKADSIQKLTIKEKIRRIVFSLMPVKTK